MQKVQNSKNIILILSNVITLFILSMTLILVVFNLLINKKSIGTVSGFQEKDIAIPSVSEDGVILKYLIVSYKIDGKSFSLKSVFSYDEEDYPLNKELEISYFGKYPAIAYIDSFKERWFKIILLLAFVGFFLISRMFFIQNIDKLNLEKINLKKSKNRS